jgi:integrase/recombinase XerD
MSNLGSLLLRGLRSRRASAGFARHERSRKKLSASSTKNSDANFKLSISGKRIPRATTAIAKTKLISAVGPVAKPAEQLLAGSAMIRPQGQLKKSIESFLLDLRSEHTRRAYGKDLNRFVKFLLAQELLEGAPSINRALLIRYKDQLLSENLEHTTIDRHLATLRSFFRWLVEDGVIEKNPAENVRFLNPKRESRTIGFSDDEVMKVLQVPNLHSKIGSLHYAVLMVLFYGGLRRSELCDLRTSNLGFERAHHFIRLRGKGNAERIVVMLEPVWNAIQHYLKMNHKEASVEQPLFSPVRNNRTHTQNKALDPSMIFYIVKRYARLAGIENRVSPHSCRATAISNARDHNVPDRAIQEFAGWSTTTMITRYDKRKTSLEKSAVHAISYGKDARKLPVDGK